MKRLIMISLFFALFVGLSSCTQKPAPQKVTTTVTNEKVTYSDQGFLVEQQTIVAGNTVWGISERLYGTGMKWRDIVALNPFLNTPDRLYYNPDRKMWIVRIYPGEVLNIGGQKVYPSCTYERTTTTTVTEPVVASDSAMPWWGWMLIILIPALLLLLGAFLIWGRATASSSSSAAVFIDVRNNVGLATREALLEREMSYREDALHIVRRASRKGQLKSFRVREDAGYFDLKAKFRKKPAKTNGAPGTN